MDQKILDAYRKARRKISSLPAYHALVIAMEENKTQQLDWKYARHSSYGMKTVSLERDGFTCLLAIRIDSDHDFTQFRGTFSNEWSQDAVANPDWHDNEYSVYRYFHPEVKVEDHRRELTKMGYSRGDAEAMARQYVLEDMKIAKGPDASGYSAYSVHASVLLHNVELGEDALYGIETDEGDTDPYLEELALSCLTEALHLAKEKLTLLQQTFSSLQD